MEDHSLHRSHTAINAEHECDDVLRYVDSLSVVEPPRQDQGMSLISKIFAAYRRRAEQLQRTSRAKDRQS